MKRFKEVPENPNDVCQHLHRFFLPLLDEMRESQILQQGMKELTANDLNGYNSLFLSKKYLYKGEIDPLGRACGLGTAIDARNPKHFIKGTFYNDLPHGICVEYNVLGDWSEREYINGVPHGKGTTYNKKGEPTNNSKFIHGILDSVRMKSKERDLFLMENPRFANYSEGKAVNVFGKSVRQNKQASGPSLCELCSIQNQKFKIAGTITGVSYELQRFMIEKKAQIQKENFGYNSQKCRNCGHVIRY